MFVLFAGTYMMRKKETLNTALNLAHFLKSFPMIGVVLFVVQIRAYLKNLNKRSRTQYARVSSWINVGLGAFIIKQFSLKDPL